MTHVASTRPHTYNVSYGKQIIIQSGVNVWPHELKTAQALAEAGYDVEFVRRSVELRAKSADVRIDGVFWEMKAPRSDKASAVDKNVRKALHQAKCVAFDSRRMKNVPDSTVERELRKGADMTALGVILVLELTMLHSFTCW